MGIRFPVSDKVCKLPTGKELAAAQGISGSDAMSALERLNERKIERDSYDSVFAKPTALRAVVR
jgi:hypothetical protein